VSDRVDSAVAGLEGVAAPPRDNGELVFQAPWEARAFALAVALVDTLELPWTAFRKGLIEQIQLDPARPYYESWAVALESFVVGLGITDADEINAATPDGRATL
jgi:nitrile hydratase accessory protein